ncbi:MAG: methyltransferase [Propionibacteriales bacterium]|nr:methyltransferase [Propionibacteriales bacterium]
MTVTKPPRAGGVQHAEFGGLDIAWDTRVLQPRSWTAEQGEWAAQLTGSSPSGPLLELCCGAGQIGLLSARASGRALVQVDLDPVAAAYARRNAAVAGIPADVRCGAMTEVLRPDELFPVIVADPPWLPTAGVAAFPDDPLTAVDGGVDGCDLIRSCIDVAVSHLSPGGHLVLQVGDLKQLVEVEGHLSRLSVDLTVLEVRDRQPRGVLVHLGPWSSIPVSNETGP